MSFIENTASDGFSITPSDSDLFAENAMAIYVGGAGAIALVTTNGTSLTFSGVLAGSVLPVKAKQVLSTGTTATNLVGLTKYS